MARASNKQVLSNEKQIQEDISENVNKKAGKRGRKNKQQEAEPVAELEDLYQLEVIPALNIIVPNQPVVGTEIEETVEVNEVNDDNNDDGSIKTKRRGRKPKDKFKYETADIDEYARNNKKDDNVIIKLPLSCLKLNEEFNLGKDLFPYNPVITTPKPYNPEDLKGGNIGYSLLNDNLDVNIDEDIGLGNTQGLGNNLLTNTQGLGNNLLTNTQGLGNNLLTNTQVLENAVSLDGSRSVPNNDITPDQRKFGSNKCQNCQNCQCHRNGSEIILSMEKERDKDTRQIDIILNNKYYTNTDKFNVLTHLGGCMNGDKWPEKTDIPCLWDCHSFKNTPWGVPYKFTNGKFQLFGNFCSANCVLSYILHFYQDDDALWEKVALLNLLNFKVYKEYTSIVPAFDKMGLKMFGGTLEIEEYRNITGTNDKSYGVEFPPCNTIIPMLEEIYKKTNLNNTFIPVDKSRIQAANNELKLKRSKPVVNHKNTLDFCLGKA